MKFSCQIYFVSGWSAGKWQYIILVNKWLSASDEQQVSLLQLPSLSSWFTVPVIFKWFIKCSCSVRSIDKDVCAVAILIKGIVITLSSLLPTRNVTLYVFYPAITLPHPDFILQLNNVTMSYLCLCWRYYNNKIFNWNLAAKFILFPGWSAEKWCT